MSSISAHKLEEGKEYLFRRKNYFFYLSESDNNLVLGKGIYIGIKDDGYYSFQNVKLGTRTQDWEPEEPPCVTTHLYYSSFEFFKPINRTMLRERLYFHTILLRNGIHKDMVKVIVTDFFPNDCIY